MKEFTRQPTALERAIAVVLTALLCLLFGALAAFLAFHEYWIAALVFAVLFLAMAVLFSRAAFGKRRQLTGKKSRALAWGLVIFSLAALPFAFLPYGSVADRLLVLGPCLGLLSAGIAGLKARASDV